MRCGRHHGRRVVERNCDAVLVDVGWFTRELRNGGRLFLGFASEHLIDREHAACDDCAGKAVLAVCAGDHVVAGRGVLGFETCDIGIDTVDDVVFDELVVAFLRHTTSVPTV